MKKKQSFNEESLVEIAEFYLALSEPARVRIIREMMDYGAGSVNELTERCGLSQSSTSKHLKILHKAGFLLKNKVESKSLYELDEEMAQAFLDFALNNILRIKQQGVTAVAKKVAPIKKAAAAKKTLPKKEQSVKKVKKEVVKKQEPAKKVKEERPEDSNQLMMF